MFDHILIGMFFEGFKSAVGGTTLNRNLIDFELENLFLFRRVSTWVKLQNPLFGNVVIRELKKEFNFECHCLIFLSILLQDSSNYTVPLIKREL